MKLKHVTYEQALVLHQLGMPVSGTCFYIPGDPLADTTPGKTGEGREEFLVLLVQNSHHDPDSYVPEVRPESVEDGASLPRWPNWITLVSSDSEGSHVETY